MLYFNITLKHGRAWTTVHNNPLVEWAPHIEEEVKRTLNKSNTDSVASQ